MAIIAYPSPHRHVDVTLRPRVSSQTNRSELTGARQAIDIGYSWWDCSISVAPMLEADSFAWILFFGRVRGPTNSFRVPVTADDQHSGTFTVRAAGAGSGYTLATDGWPNSTTVLVAGQKVTVGDQLMTLDADAETSETGTATLQFHAPLRGTVADNTVIETKQPYLLAALPEDSPALTLTPARIQAGFSFDVVEAY